MRRDDHAIPDAAARTDAAVAQDAPAAREFTLSVRTKGLIVFAALIIYGIVIAAFVFHQKDVLLQEFDQIQQSLETDSQLKQADAAAFSAVMAVFANIEAADRAAGMQRVQMHFQLLRNRHAELAGRNPDLGISLSGVNQAIAVAQDDPSKDNMNRLIVELVKIKNDFTSLAQQSELSRKRMSERYRKQADSVTLTAMLLGALGLALLGAITGLFFRQLTLDLNMLRGRALAIVNGYRGDPIPVRRHDEVGQLMTAVNGMAEALDKREKELMLERQKYFHQEKMAAIGALAAGVAHEINNPIAAISGIAEEMVQHREQTMGECTAEDCATCRPDLIHEHTRRLAAITREIAEFASPQAAEPQWMDLNARLRSSASLIRYDRRAREVELELHLDSQLPAVYGVADHVTQVIMNLLINAMDALEDKAEGPRRVVVTTRKTRGQVELLIEDNGHGMDAQTLDRVFDAFFTTKPAGKGTGLGLSLCYSIMKTHGGNIDIESAPGKGTTVHVFFPVTDTEYKDSNNL